MRYYNYAINPFVSAALEQTAHPVNIQYPSPLEAAERNRFCSGGGVTNPIDGCNFISFGGEHLFTLPMRQAITIITLLVRMRQEAERGRTSRERRRVPRRQTGWQ